MTTVYTQHRVTSVYVGETEHQHSNEGEDDGQTPFGVDCVACEPYLVKMGFVYNAELVPLTDAQEREQERVVREGNVAVHDVAKALAAAAATQLLQKSQDDAPAKPGKRGLSDEQKARMAEGRKAKAEAKAKVAAEA